MAQCTAHAVMSRSCLGSRVQALSKQEGLGLRLALHLRHYRPVFPRSLTFMTVVIVLCPLHILVDIGSEDKQGKRKVLSKTHTLSICLDLYFIVVGMLAELLIGVLLHQVIRINRRGRGEGSILASLLSRSWMFSCLQF